MARKTYSELPAGTIVTLAPRADGITDPRYEGGQWEVISDNGGMLFLHFVGGDQGATCGAFGPSVTVVSRPAA